MHYSAISASTTGINLNSQKSLKSGTTEELAPEQTLQKIPL